MKAKSILAVSMLIFVALLYSQGRSYSAREKFGASYQHPIANEVGNGNLPVKEVDALIKTYGARLGRYIVPCHHLISNPYQEWKDFAADLMECNYTQDDRKGKKGPIIDHKRATAIVLNPSMDLLAKWVVATCMIVKHDASTTCTDSLMRRIIGASNAQFIVAGVVLEDQTPCFPAMGCGDGIIEAYNFRDGVTVSIQGGLKNFSTIQPTDPQIAKSLDPNSQITAVHKFARLQSTCREHYQLSETELNRKPENVKGKNWLRVVRESYQDAWKRAHDPSLPEGLEKYRNKLVIAWEMEHSKVPDEKCK